MIYLILIISACFYIALLVWVFRPEYVLCGIVKEDKRCSRGKSVPKLFNASELCVLNKIIYNMPVLGDDTPAHMEALANAGFNMMLPVYKIDIGGHKNLKALCGELKILKRLEESGYSANIVINFDGRRKSGSNIIRENSIHQNFGRIVSRTRNFFYNDILILAASMNFEKCVVKIHQAEFLSSAIMFAVNAFNINKIYTSAAANKREGIWFEIGSKTLDCDREYYDDFIYKGSVSSGDITIIRKRTASFKKGYMIERLAISNLGKDSKEVTFNIFLGLGTGEDEACYTKVVPHKGGIKVVDYKNKVECYYSTSCGLLRNLNITKLGIEGQMKAKIRGGSVFYVYIVSSKEFMTVQNLERGEELFFEARNEYKNLKPLSVQSNNISFDRLINLLLPQRIISKFIDDPKLVSDFDGFRNLVYVAKFEYINSLKGLYVKNNNLVGSYFDLLWQFAGVSFLEHGIKINLQRRWLLDDLTIRFEAEGNPITLKIKKQGIEQGFIYNGVEYYNIGFLPYKLLAQNSNAVIDM
ncbi:MAG: hypothetical protein LBN07_02525 [Christensenellaceae bacterium]|nr:hypothetical protein [Christensenellaceae bacterium]